MNKNITKWKQIKDNTSYHSSFYLYCYPVQAEKKDSTQTETVSNKAIVRVETVSAQDVEQISEFTATVEANISNNIAPQTPVRIEKLFAEVGDHVKAGQLLVKMDETNLKQTKIQLDNQELEFKRIDELYKVGGASKSAWDAQKTQLDISRATYKNLQENTQLLSPITGIVTARNYDSGDMYSGGLPIFTVEQIRPVKLLINVSESLFTKVKKGKDVDIRLDVYGDEVFKGKDQPGLPDYRSEYTHIPCRNQNRQQ